MPDANAHGAAHPLPSFQSTGDAWELAPGVFAWTIDGDVVIQGDDGDVTIPAAQLPSLARGLLAQHVTNGRPDRRTS